VEWVIHKGAKMKVRLLESAHDTWAPAGTVGELEDYGTVERPMYFLTPDSIAPDGLWIGRVKWEEVVETVVVKPRKRGK